MRGTPQINLKMKIVGSFAIVCALFYVILVVNASRSFHRNLKATRSTREVKLVTVITRHGDRTPIFSFPPANLPPVTWDCELPATIEAVPIQIFDSASPPFPRLYRKIYKKDIETFAGNCAAGQLTVKGMRQHFALGSRLRNQYSSLLENVDLRFGTKEVYVESSDIPRTFLSAQSQLLALFPPKTSTAFNAAEVVPIITTELAVSEFYPNYVTCPRLSTIQGAIHKSKSFIDFQTKILPFKNDLATKLKYSNSSATGFPAWSQIYDTFWCRRSHDFPLPPGFTTQLIDDITLTAEEEYRFVLNDRDFVHLGIGRLFTRIKEKLSDAISGKDTDLKYALFSGHDTTIAPLLALLGFYDGSWPPYASNLVFELSEDPEATPDARWGVRIIYNEKELTLKGCPGNQPCPWKVFDAMTKPLELTEEEHKAKCVV